MNQEIEKTNSTSFFVESIMTVPNLSPTTYFYVGQQIVERQESRVEDIPVESEKKIYASIMRSDSD